MAYDIYSQTPVYDGEGSGRSRMWRSKSSFATRQETGIWW